MSTLPEAAFKTIQRPVALPNVEIHRGRHLRDEDASAYCTSYGVVLIDGAVAYRARGKHEEWQGRFIALVEAGEFIGSHARQGVGFQHWFITPEAMREAALDHGLSHAPHFTRNFVADNWGHDVLSRLSHAFNDAPGTLEQHELMTRLFDVVLDRYVDTGRPRSDCVAHRAVRRMREFIHAAYAEEISLDVLAADARINKFHALRAFKRAIGVTPHEYQRHLRIANALTMLRAGMRAADVAYALGFCDQSHFARTFRQMAGITPRQYQLGG